MVIVGSCWWWVRDVSSNFRIFVHVLEKLHQKFSSNGLFTYEALKWLSFLQNKRDFLWNSYIHTGVSKRSKVHLYYVIEKPFSSPNNNFSTKSSARFETYAKMGLGGSIKKCSIPAKKMVRKIIGKQTVGTNHAWCLPHSTHNSGQTRSKS